MSDEIGSGAHVMKALNKGTPISLSLGGAAVVAIGVGGWAWARFEAVEARVQQAEVERAVLEVKIDNARDEARAAADGVNSRLDDILIELRDLRAAISRSSHP